MLVYVYTLAELKAKYGKNLIEEDNYITCKLTTQLVSIKIINDYSGKIIKLKEVIRFGKKRQHFHDLFIYNYDFFIKEL